MVLSKMSRWSKPVALGIASTGQADRNGWITLVRIEEVGGKTWLGMSWP